MPPSTSTTSGGCSSTSRAATPTCTAASSASRTTTGADLGVVFFHNAGYSTACGHGTIALVTWAVESGVVERGGRDRVVVDVPSGGCETVARVEGGTCASRCASATCRRSSRDAGSRRPAARSTSPSAARSTPRCEERVEPAELPRLIELGRAIKRDLEATTRSSIRSSRSSATSTASIFWQAEGEDAADAAERHRLRRRRGRPLTVRQRHVGAARAARRDGRLARREPLRHLTIVGSEFTRPGRRPEVGGRRRHRGRGQRPPDRPARVRARARRRAGEGFLLR